MKLSEFKAALQELDHLVFVLPNGNAVPAHFHITEAAHNIKHYIDCGGTERKEQTISFQLWTAQDFDHRLSPAKLLQIIDIYEKKINQEDIEVEIEYQGDTIGKYALARESQTFMLLPKFTDCLAQDACGIPAESMKKPKIELANVGAKCTPGGGCC